MPAESVGVVVAHEDRAVVEEVAEILDATPGVFVAGTSIEAVRPGQVVVAGGEALVTVRSLEQPLVALACGDPLRAARAALSAGARELLRWPDESDRLAGAIARAAVPDRKTDTARLIAVIGARGGIGTTTVTTLVAASVEDGLVVDLGGGTRGREAPERTLHDLLDPSPEQLTAALAGDVRTLHPRRFADPISIAQLNGVLRTAGSVARQLILDCATGAHETQRAAFARADVRVLVASDDVASIRGARALASVGIEPSKLVLRRVRRRGISMRDLIAAYGRAPSCVIPPDRRTARALDLDAPPPTRSKTMRAIARLAEQL